MKGAELQPKDGCLPACRAKAVTEMLSQAGHYQLRTALPHQGENYFILYCNQDYYCWQTLCLTSHGICSPPEQGILVVWLFCPCIPESAGPVLTMPSPPPGDYRAVSGSAEQVPLVYKDKTLFEFCTEDSFPPLRRECSSLRCEGREALSPSWKHSSVWPRFLVHDWRKQDAQHAADAVCASSLS